MMYSKELYKQLSFVFVQVQSCTIITYLADVDLQIAVICIGEFSFQKCPVE